VAAELVVGGETTQGAAPEPAAEEATDPGSGAIPDDLLTTEIVGSGEAYRRVGEIFVSVLAALPAAAFVTSLIKAPGETGLEEGWLMGGLAAAVAAVGFGIIVALRVRAPVELSKSELENFPMQTIIGTNQPTYDRLLERIDQLGDALAAAEGEAQKKRVERRLNAAVATLRRVHLVATAKELKKRSLDELTIGCTAAALIAAGFAAFALALAPKPKPSEPGPAATVVDVTLTPDGAKSLGCPTDVFAALKVGGTETEPQVVPLGGVDCEAGDLLKLKVAEEEGTAQEVKAVDAANAVAEPAGTGTEPATTDTESTTTTGTAPTTTGR